jgi:uncharacterized membrane protein
MTLMNRAPFFSLGLAAMIAVAACGDEESTAVSAGSADPITVYGFLLEGDVLTTIEPPGDPAPGPDGQEAFEILDINNVGQMAGYFTDQDGRIRGFLRENGAFNTIDYPGAGSTSVSEVNDHGVMVGTYEDVAGDAFTSHGFVLEDDVFTAVDLPDALATSLASMNDEGVVLGTYIDRERKAHGFLLDDGGVTTIDFPGATVTLATKLNDKGQAVGFFSETDPTIPVTRSSGFLRDEDGEFTRIDVPDALPGATVPVGINNDATIVGAYVASEGMRNLGFRRDGDNYTNIDFPEADIAVGALDINDRQQIVGIYLTVGDEKDPASSSDARVTRR